MDCGHDDTAAAALDDEYDGIAAASMDDEYDDTAAAAMDCEHDDIVAAAIDCEHDDTAAALDIALDEQSHGLALVLCFLFHKQRKQSTMSTIILSYKTTGSRSTFLHIDVERLYILF